MSGINPTDELLNRAFGLAYFILGERTASIYLAMTAMDRLKTALTIQGRRRYYAPTARTKVSVGHLHLLQRLVCVESEPFERLIEGQTSQLRRHDMIIRFVKHLVMVTTARNSFYVTLGLCRLLHNYTTVEAAEIYSLVIQNPDRGRDDYYFRARKQHLLRELKGRFGGSLKTYRGHRGEERFESEEGPEQYELLVRECLSRFMPWGSSCVLRDLIDPTKDVIDSLDFKGASPDGEHAIELNRIHTLLHPDCFRRLGAALALDPPERRLEVPRFYNVGEGGGMTDDRLSPATLSVGELDAIRRYLEKNALRRSQVSGSLFSVLVDGKELGSFEAAKAGGFDFTLREGAELVEVRSAEADEAVTLAVHSLSCAGGVGAPHSASAETNAGFRLSLSLRPSEASGEFDGAALATLGVTRRKPFQITAAWLRRLAARVGGRNGHEGRPAFTRTALAAILLALLCAAAFLIYRRAGDAPQGAKQTGGPGGAEMEGGDLGRAPTPAPTARATPPAERDTARQPPPPPAPPSGTKRTPRAGSPKRPPAPPAAPGEVAELRGRRPGHPSLSLLSIRRVYVDPLGNGPQGRQVREALSEALKTSGRFAVVVSRNDADAVFKGVVRPAAMGRGRVVVDLRLVDAAGQAVWTTKLPRNGNKYSGRRADVVRRVVEGLLSEIQKLEGRR